MSVYLIMGGSSGIGLAIAKKLAVHNDVVIVGRSYKKLEAARNSITSANNCYTYSCDLSNPENVSSVFDFLSENDICLGGVVYCAGVSPLCLLRDNSLAEMERVFRINFFSFVETCKYFYMKEHSLDGSKIVGISSVTAHSAGYRQLLYGSSKAAMVAATRLMAGELRNRNIKINCLSPGSVDTELLQSLYKSPEDLQEKVAVRQPLGVIPPERVAEVVEMLLSPTGDFVTGQEFIYDGGFLLK